MKNLALIVIVLLIIGFTVSYQKEKMELLEDKEFKNPKPRNQKAILSIYK
ncbi:hypothetical protein ABWH96_01580 [Marivirga tractuosa]